MPVATIHQFDLPPADLLAQGRAHQGPIVSPADGEKVRRTTNPIESSFATIRHRTTRTKNCVSRNTLLGLAFQLALTAEKSWRKLGGVKLLPDVVQGNCFVDDVRVTDQPPSEFDGEQQVAA